MNYKSGPRDSSCKISEQSNFDKEVENQQNISTSLVANRCYLVNLCAIHRSKWIQLFAWTCLQSWFRRTKHDFFRFLASGTRVPCHCRQFGFKSWCHFCWGSWSSPLWLPHSLSWPRWEVTSCDGCDGPTSSWGNQQRGREIPNVICHS